MTKIKNPHWRKSKPVSYFQIQFTVGERLKSRASWFQIQLRSLGHASSSLNEHYDTSTAVPCAISRYNI